jgi:hypothetical protein
VRQWRAQKETAKKHHGPRTYRIQKGVIPTLSWGHSEYDQQWTTIDVVRHLYEVACVCIHGSPPQTTYVYSSCCAKSEISFKGNDSLMETTHGRRILSLRSRTSPDLHRGGEVE